MEHRREQSGILGFLGGAALAVAEAVAPRWALRRQALTHLREIRARQHERFMERYYDGADETGRLRGDKWLKSRLSPDSELELELEASREHSRQLYKNFGYATGVVDHRTDNVVGCGLAPKAAIRPGTFGFGGPVITISEQQAEQWNRELDAVYELWAPRAGRSGRKSFGQCQRLAHRCWKRDGDVLVIMSDVGRADKPIPLQVDVVAAERLETPPGESGNPRIRLGVETDREGDVLRYHVRDTHPDDNLENDFSYTPYEAWRVCHLHEELFAGQSRGLPWGFSVQTDARDFKDFKEATIISAEAAACVMMVIATQNPDLIASGALNSDGEQEMEPGKIMYTQLGDQVNQITPNQPGTTYGMFSEWSLLGYAGGMNYPFGWVVKDRRRATYSAGRLEEIDGGVVLECDHMMLRDQLIAPVWQRLVQEAVIVGAVSIPPGLFRQMPHLFTRFRLTPKGRPWVDPPKESSAAETAVNNNQDTLERVLARRGMDLDETLEQRARELRKQRELGIEPVSSQPPGAAPADPAGDPAQDPAEDPAMEALAV